MKKFNSFLILFLATLVFIVVYSFVPQKTSHAPTWYAVGAFDGYGYPINEELGASIIDACCIPSLIIPDGVCAVYLNEPPPDYLHEVQQHNPQIASRIPNCQ